jgi:hypothetical protein
MPFVPVHPGAVTFAMLQLGYHGGDLIQAFFSERQNDFWEMLLHHVAATSVLTCMVFANGMSIGCSIAYLHDIADITTSMAKWLSQTKYDRLTAGVFVCNMLIWAYTRNYLLVKYVYFIWTEYCYGMPPAYEQYAWSYRGCGVMITGMLLLHFYWMALFFKILFSY